MISLIRRNKAFFDTVVEGANPPFWEDHQFRICNLDVSETVDRIVTPRFSFYLYGTTDFKKVIPAIPRSTHEDFRTEDLGHISGLTVLPLQQAGLARPTSVILRDGRVFIDSFLMENSLYCPERLNEVINGAGYIFGSPEYEEAFRSKEKWISRLDPMISWRSVPIASKN